MYGKCSQRNFIEGLRYCNNLTGLNLCTNWPNRTSLWRWWSLRYSAILFDDITSCIIYHLMIVWRCEDRRLMRVHLFLHPILPGRYRFAEVRYHRPQELHKGRVVPARVETVVIFLPDVWSCSPTRLEWEALQGAYKCQLSDKITEENKDDTQAQLSCYIFFILLYPPDHDSHCYRHIYKFLCCHNRGWSSHTGGGVIINCHVTSHSSHFSSPGGMELPSSLAEENRRG